jgi:hypothetical protein
VVVSGGLILLARASGIRKAQATRTRTTPEPSSARLRRYADLRGRTIEPCVHDALWGWMTDNDAFTTSEQAEIDQVVKGLIESL